jgi:hypothetical protein
MNQRLAYLVESLEESWRVRDECEYVTETLSDAKPGSKCCGASVQGVSVRAYVYIYMYVHVYEYTTYACFACRRRIHMFEAIKWPKMLLHATSNMMLREALKKHHDNHNLHAYMYTHEHTLCALYTACIPVHATASCAQQFQNKSRECMIVYVVHIILKASNSFPT